MILLKENIKHQYKLKYEKDGRGIQLVGGSKDTKFKVKREMKLPAPNLAQLKAVRDDKTGDIIYYSNVYIEI